MTTKRGLGPALSAPVTLWLLLAFAAPIAVVVILSLRDTTDPFAPILGPLSPALYLSILGDSFYLDVILETLLLGLAVTFCSAVLGYPLAWWLSRLPSRWRPLGFALILIPILTNVVVRSLGIMLLLAPQGLLNGVLSVFGLPSFDHMLFSHGAVIVGLTQVFMPFMVLALYDSLQGNSARVHEAAESLGASPCVRFLTVDLPLSLSGLRSGMVIVFLMAITAYVSATLLGGKKVWTVGMLILQEAIANLNAPMAAALSILLTAIGILSAVLLSWLFSRLMPWHQGRPGRPLPLPPRAVLKVLDMAGPLIARLCLLAAILLLLLPLALVIVQSFNDVPIATAAGFRGFTLHWYHEVLFGGAYGPALWISVKLAVCAALVALTLALPAAFALARYPFAGRSALAAFWLLPLSLPSIALGVGMLRLLQVYLWLPPFLAMVMIHSVVILPFVLTLLLSSVLSLDRSQEEAAETLGAGPVRRFLLVILPALSPGIFAATLVGFLNSFGEVTVTSFLTTPRITTLPVRIYSEASFLLEPTAHAISAMLIVLTTALLIVLGRFIRLDRVYAR
ncbi:MULTISPECIES: ABC transporter permease subunit [unclassified Haematobacter]|uniref:ABC transporter permease subunit n=1 Tax=unclassified Haematobacter TaxID=2640585 RepID=UPI0025B8168E|nr:MULTISPECIES: ABC transporter permease subunit [unclassified Haematobacter]